MNEEEIRGKLLLPFLNDLGFDPTEISLEQSFAVRLGKSKHVIHGRFDILCKRNNQNLFIIELKNDSIEISQDDIDQGISYARILVGNIAPFTIVTNGKSTRIFDSISKLEITGKRISEHSDFWKNGTALSIEDDLVIRYEALKKFISFSHENLKLFCRDQVLGRMGPIVGDVDTNTSKFVKKLYVQRKDLRSSFGRFIESDAKVFGIVGAAGVGKTNTMCSLALKGLEDSFVFFYNAAIIHKSPVELIAQDLNLFFSSKSESELILRKLNELGIFVKKTILIFIDAIDESLCSNIALELSELAIAARSLESIKICVSCKSSVWPQMLEINGTPTHLLEELRKFHCPIQSVDNLPGYLINEFDEEEMQKIIPLYKDAFGFKGDLSKSVLEYLKNGFFLRIFSTVYGNRQIPIRINDRRLIRDYLYQSLDMTNINRQMGLRILSEVGRVLIDHEYKKWASFSREGINYETLLERLNIPLEQVLPEGLFARNILTKSSTMDSLNISFYYSKIRDYIICYHTFKLHELDNDQFYKILDTFYQNYIGESAIKFYLENASEDHKYTLAKFKEKKAINYVSIYESYLDENFRNFKKQFVPKTDGEIGIVLPKDLNRDGYALYPLRSKLDQKIIYENLDNPFSDSYYDSRLFEIGVEVVHGSHFQLLRLDQDRVAKGYIYKQLGDIIKKGRIPSDNIDTLLIEQVSAMVYHYSSKLGYDSKIADFYVPRFDAIYPIDLQDVLNKIYRFRAFQFYQRKGIPSRDIHGVIENAFRRNIEIPRMNSVGDFPPLEELSRIVEILIKRGHLYIEKHYLPYPDRSVNESKEFLQKSPKKEISNIINSQFSTERVRLYIECLFGHIEKCYKEFVELNFPTFKGKFHFFTSMPHEYFFYIKEEEGSRWGYLGYRTSENDQVKFQHKEFYSSSDAFDKDKIDVLYGISFDNFIRVDYLHLVKTVDQLNTPKVDESCVVRSWIFRILKSDIKGFFKENEEYI
ncbi:type I restriction enzyme HsdR N-terminal domain-containing protein [Dyadobacter jiangsuensis]